jgi:heme exporter protein B
VARRGDAFQPALFALLTVVALFALALGGDAESLAAVASAVLWLAVLLAGLLSLDSLFRGDAEDGSLEQWMLAPVPLCLAGAGAHVMHWATTALPLVVAVPLLGELLHLPRAQLPVLMASAAAGHADAEPARRGGGRADRGHAPRRRAAGAAGLPLYVPVLVFGAGAVAAAHRDFDAGRRAAAAGRGPGAGAGAGAADRGRSAAHRPQLTGVNVRERAARDDGGDPGPTGRPYALQELPP